MVEAVTLPCAGCGALNRVPEGKLNAAPACGKCKASLFTGKPITANQAKFNRLATKGDVPILVDFWAPWCGPCQAMAPAFASAAAKLEPDLRLVKVDTQAEPTLAARYAIQSIPTLMVLKNGREIARTSGAMAESAIIAWARQVLSTA